MSIRTDLAMETQALLKRDCTKGVTTAEQKLGDGILVTTVEISNDAGSKAMDKPIGTYTCVFANKIKEASPEYFEKVVDAFSEELLKFLPKNSNSVTLVVGLGNRGITADALGSKTVDKLLITRHLKGVIPGEISDCLNSVCAITPSVLGITGIESAQIVESIVQAVQPTTVIVIDSLASRAIDKIGCTFQITDTGIVPGSGVGNARDELSEKTLGCKVIAVGVPMVVYATTIVHDIAEQLAEKGALDERAIKAIIEHKNCDMVVTPKEIDDMIDGVSTIIAKGINIGLHPNADKDLIEQLMF